CHRTCHVLVSNPHHLSIRQAEPNRNEWLALQLPEYFSFGHAKYSTFWGPIALRPSILYLRSSRKMSFPRHQILAHLRELISKRIPIIGGGAGTGISAKFEEEGGIDLIVIYN